MHYKKLLDLWYENEMYVFHLEWSQALLQSLRGSLEMRRFKHVVMPTRHCLTLDPTPTTSRDGTPPMIAYAVILIHLGRSGAKLTGKYSLGA